MGKLKTHCIAPCEGSLSLPHCQLRHMVCHLSGHRWKVLVDNKLSCLDVWWIFYSVSPGCFPHPLPRLWLQIPRPCAPGIQNMLLCKGKNKVEGRDVFLITTILTRTHKNSFSNLIGLVYRAGAMNEFSLHLQHQVQCPGNRVSANTYATTNLKIIFMILYTDP